MKYGILIALLVLTACAKQPQPWNPPAMPADLSPETWSLPEPVKLPVEQKPAEAPPRHPAPNEQLYHYDPGVEYDAYVQIGWPLDVILEPGEKWHSVVDGDRTPLADDEEPCWEVKASGNTVSESEYMPVQHIFVTACKPSKHLGLIITTSRRTYYLTVHSLKKTEARVIRWTYPPAPVKVEPKVTILPDQAVVQRYHVGYQVQGPEGAVDWRPLWIGDDGTKTYLIFSPVVLYQEMPLLRGIGATGPFLVNSRQYKTVVIVDRLLAKLELRYGTGEHTQVVTVSRGVLATIECPGHEACPIWPQEN